MKRVIALFALVSMLMLTGCLYSNIKTPLDTDVDRTVLGQKTGTASTYSILWLVSWGDGSTSKAAHQGGLSTINHMDLHVFSVLFGLYSQTTLIVYGE